MKYFITVLLVPMMCVAVSCSKSSHHKTDDSESEAADTDSDSQTETGVDTQFVLDTSSDTLSDTVSDMSTATETWRDSDIGVDTQSDTEDDSGTDTESVDYTETDSSATGTDSDSASGEIPDTQTESDSATDTVEDTDTDPAIIMNPECIRIDRVKGVEYAPSAVRVTFRVLGCSGYPVRKLTSDDVSVINDVTGNDFNESSEGGGASAPGLPSDLGFFTVLALDMSDSIFNNNRVNDVISGAKIFVEQMVTNAPENQKQQVAILVFGRTNAISMVQDFTDDDALLNARLDALLNSSSLGTTNLYGGYMTALEAVSNEGKDLDLVGRSVVILTDGTHEAGDEANLRKDAIAAKVQAEYYSDVTVFSIGIQGDYDESKLAELATKGEYFVMAENAGVLKETFSEVAHRLDYIAHSNYVVGVCTPVELGSPSLTIEVDMGTATDSKKVFYSTSDLTGDLSSCDPKIIASPCNALQCGPGAIKGFSCGTCKGATEWCSSGVCVEGCADLECGASPVGDVNCGICDGATEWCNSGTCVNGCDGLECGKSPDGKFNCGACTGATEWCDAGTCVEGCADLQCGTSPVGGVNCGTCTGATDWCNAGLCLDDCAGLQCGVSPNEGFDCGTCLGATEWCDGGTCVNDCAGLECGDSPNEDFDCGTCSGATEWCNAGTCEEACGSQECGTSPVGDVNCGTCPGATEWCNGGTCIEACGSQECGMSPIGDVNCGTCPGVTDWCNAGVCEENNSLGTWVPITGGTFEMGSTVGEDNELPVHTVTVGNFEMLKTEVTASQYKACVDAGACESIDNSQTSATYDRIGFEDNPINFVSHVKAIAYCAWIGGRLPSEAEWEYAARSQGQDRRYAWGDQYNCTYLVYAGCSTTGESMPVCSLPAGNSDQGLCDIAGNVEEFTADEMHDTYDGAPSDGSAWADGQVVGAVIKGGNYALTGYQARAAYRRTLYYVIGQYGVGFRCVR